MTRSSSSRSTKRSRMVAVGVVAMAARLAHVAGAQLIGGTASGSRGVTARRRSPRRPRARPPRSPRSPRRPARGAARRARRARAPARATAAIWAMSGHGVGARQAQHLERARRGGVVEQAQRMAGQRPGAPGGQVVVGEPPDRVVVVGLGSSTRARSRSRPAGASAGLQLAGSKARAKGTSGSSTWIQGSGLSRVLADAEHDDADRAHPRAARQPAGGGGGRAAAPPRPAGIAITAWPVAIRSIAESARRRTAGEALRPAPRSPRPPSPGAPGRRRPGPPPPSRP